MVSKCCSALLTVAFEHLKMTDPTLRVDPMRGFPSLRLNAMSKPKLTASRSTLLTRSICPSGARRIGYGQFGSVMSEKPLSKAHCRGNAKGTEASLK